MRGWRGGWTNMGVEWGECRGGGSQEGGGKKPKIRPFRAFYGEIKKIVGL